jgi:hypothetical protein
MTIRMAPVARAATAIGNTTHGFIEWGIFILPREFLAMTPPSVHEPPVLVPAPSGGSAFFGSRAPTRKNGTMFPPLRQVLRSDPAPRRRLGITVHAQAAGRDSAASVSVAGGRPGAKAAQASRARSGLPGHPYGPLKVLVRGAC